MKVNKLITVFLIILILFTYLPVYAFQKMDFLEYGTPSKTNWDNALHFIVKHWHVDEYAQNNLEESEDDKNIAVVEGYIVPEDGKSGYEFYYVNQDNKDINSLNSIKSDYVSSFDNKTGKITLSIKPMQNSEGNPIEHFSGISISAGHSALDSEDSKNNIVISYQKNVHLVKAHIFYSNEKITVYGSGKDDAVFGNTEKQDNDEKDTDFVYTYKNNGVGHTAGDVVKNGDKPVYDVSNLPAGVTQDEVEKNKVYSTLEGLHTDKTASAVSDDNRKFDLDLEAWYSGAPLADIGLVLDASGSMGFTSDDLKRININDLNLKDEEKNQLKAKELNKEKYTEKSNPTNEDWLNDIFLTEDDINLMLNPHNTDNSKLSASDYSYFIFDPRNTVNEYVPLGYWDGSVKGVKDKLIGYYEFNKLKKDAEKDTKEREWLINSVNGESASLVKQIKTSNIENISFEKIKEPEDWGNFKGVKMNESKGLNIKNNDNVDSNGGGAGILLDAKPTSNNFTISFSFQKDSTTESNNPQNYTDILYVGKESNSYGDKYYRAVRDGQGENGAVSGSGNNKNRFRGYNNEIEDKKNKELKTKLTDINSVFSKTGVHTITLVFKEGKLTSYFDGKIGDSNGESSPDANTNQNVELSGNSIIFKGFDNNYNGADLFVDNIAVFDAALDEKEVSTVEQIIKSESAKEYTVCNECFLDDNSEESIGVVSNYFVGLNGGTPGWYYVNYDSEWEKEYFNEDIQSCKRYWGIPKNGVDTSKENQQITYTDKITGVELDPKEREAETGFTYKPEESTPIEFYIDSAGYLRCFFTSSTKKETANTSYVYFKDDSNYVKTEALQHALGSFTSMLDEVSPNSKISAVRFNTDKIEEKDLDKLVLLDWTNDPIEEQDIMSLNRGDGGTKKGTNSVPDSQNEDDEPIGQYNYGLTGGTATVKGLKAFEKYLSEDVDENADKYLIIFTDGKDSTNETEQSESEKIAKELKAQGYTIFAVMLTGGSVEVSTDEDSDYYKAKEFLLKLVGNSETDSEVGAKKDSYFYSTAEDSDSIDSLTDIFTDQILNRITYNLYNYNVEDYIDPRFDLVSADNRIYTLNAEGKITIKNSDGTIYGNCDLQNGISENELIKPVTDDANKHYITVNISNSSKVERSAHNARLYYNNEKKMYYLKWVGQTIPGCTPDSKRLSVWNAKFTIKAKDDFIGGNAVLTNGNEENMNWVYNDSDKDKSSGTKDAVLPKEELASKTDSEDSSEFTPEASALDEVTGSPEDTNDQYPSKGFPRVTVNVPATEGEFSEEQLIYMGENINQEQLSEKLMQDTYNNIANTNKSYYLEYLSRYATKNSTVTLDTLKETLKKGETLTIPYYYLPNSSNTTQTGTEAHEKDPLGILEYKVIPDGENYYPEGGIIKDTNARKLIFTVKFIPLNIDGKETTETEGLDVETMEEFPSETEKASQKEIEELKNKSRKDLNDTLVQETVYKWNKEYKPVVGEPITDKGLISGTHTTNEVSGEIALQLVLTKDVREVIGDQELTYSIDLMRQNDDNKEKVGTFTAKYKKSDYPEIDKETDTTNENSETDSTQNVDTTIPTEESEQTTLPSDPTPPDEEVPETTPDENKKTYKLDENGNLIILAKIKYEDKYLEQYGLPIGTYTVENPQTSNLNNLKFELPITIKQTEQYNAELFTIGTNHEDSQTYIASLGENNEIILGKKDTEKTYTDYRFGLLQVTPITYFELPETGKNSLLQLYFLISIFTITGISIQIIKRKK